MLIKILNLRPPGMQQKTKQILSKPFRSKCFQVKNEATNECQQSTEIAAFIQYMMFLHERRCSDLQQTAAVLSIYCLHKGEKLKSSQHSTTVVDAYQTQAR